MKTLQASDVYKTLEIEDFGTRKVITYNDFMKEEVFHDIEGRQATSFSPISLEEFNNLESLYKTAGIYEEIYQDGQLIDPSEMERQDEFALDMEELRQMREDSRDDRSFGLER